MHERIERTLDGSGVYYEERRHAAFAARIASPIDFARALGFVVGRITKTMLLRSSDRQLHCVAVLPCDRRLNFGVVADWFKVKRFELASRQDLARELGYPPNGVSPLGAGDMAVLVDESLLGFTTILIGSGETGVEIEIAPVGLCELTNAAVLRLTDGTLEYPAIGVRNAK